jgi:hypothetical protein
MPRKVKEQPIVGGTVLWAMYMYGYTPLGSYADVSHGEKLYRSEEECQAAIDAMKSWVGMGDRSKYRPMPLVVA